MTQPQAVPPRWRAVLLASALLPGFACASLNPLVALGISQRDPMRAELQRLEAEQRRRSSEERLLDEAAATDRAQHPMTMEAKLARGDAHLAAGRLAGALWDYASAYELNPEAAAPRVRLGYVHLRHDPERSRPLFESALEREPELASAHTGLGLALLAGGERDAGLLHLEQAVKLAPESANAHAALGVALDQLGRHGAALDHLERARALRPRDSRVLNNLGVAYLRGGSPEKAESVLREALRQDRRDESLRSNNLGLALALQGRFEQALAAFRQAGDEQGALSNLGYVFYLRGDYDRAIEHYERALLAGGDADVQVVRNLEAAKRARVSGLAPTAPAAADLAGSVPVPEMLGAAEDAAPRPAPAADGGPAAGAADLALEGVPKPPGAADGPWLAPTDVPN